MLDVVWPHMRIALMPRDAASRIVSSTICAPERPPVVSARRLTMAASTSS
jgi:hypothetical protein